MKKIDLILLVLFILFASIVSGNAILIDYTPKIIVGGLVTVILLFTAIVMKEKGDAVKVVDLTTSEKRDRLMKVAFALRAVSWLIFFFYLMMVIFHF